MPSARIKWSGGVTPSPSCCTVARVPAEQENSSEVPSMVEDKSSLAHIRQEHFSERLKPKDGSSMLKHTVFTTFGEQVKEDKEGSLAASLSHFKNCSEEQGVLNVTWAKPCIRTHIDHVEDNEVKSEVDPNLLGASENTDYKCINVIAVKPIEQC